MEDRNLSGAEAQNLTDLDFHCKYRLWAQGLVILLMHLKRDVSENVSQQTCGIQVFIPLSLLDHLIWTHPLWSDPSGAEFTQFWICHSLKGNTSWTRTIVRRVRSTLIRIRSSGSDLTPPHSCNWTAHGLDFFISRVAELQFKQHHFKCDSTITPALILK